MLLCSGNEKNKEIVYIYILAGLNLRRGVILRRRSKLMDAQKPREGFELRTEKKAEAESKEESSRGLFVGSIRLSVREDN